MARLFLSHAQARLEGMVKWDEKNKLHLFQHSILCVSHLKVLNNVLAPNWKGSFLLPSWKSRRIKRSEAWSPTWGPLMQCSQSLPRPFKGWPTDFVQIPANFIWGSRGMAQWFLSHAQARLEGMVEWDEKNKLDLFQHSILYVSHLKGLNNILAPNWKGSFLLPSWKSRRMKRSEAWSPTWGPLMQCSQSRTSPFKGWLTDFVQIPANFIWGSRGMAWWFLSHTQARLKGMVEWAEKNKLHLFQHSILCVSHLKGLHNVLAPNWRGSFLFPSWKSRRIKRSEAWSPTWGPLMQCSQSRPCPFKGWLTDFVQIPANFIWGSRGMAQWFLSHTQARGNGRMRRKKQAALTSCLSVISRDWITSLPQIERGVSCCLVENQGGWREVRRNAPLEALLCNVPSLSRALSRDDPPILCRFPQISSEDQGVLQSETEKTSSTFTST